MTDNLGRDKLRSYADRLTRLDDERLALVEDMKTIRSEAKAEGYNVKALNAAIKRARMTAEQREAHEQFELELETYCSVIVDGETE